MKTMTNVAVPAIAYLSRFDAPVSRIKGRLVPIGASGRSRGGDAPFGARALAWIQLDSAPPT